MTQTARPSLLESSASSPITKEGTNSADEAPVSDGIGDINVEEDAPPTLINLWDAFTDDLDADQSLLYSIVENADSSIVGSPVIDVEAGTLQISYEPDAYGTTGIVVRATDSAGNFTDSAFSVSVAAVNDAPEAFADEIAADEDIAVTFNPAANDSTGPANESSQQLGITGVISLPETNGVVELNGEGTVTYTPSTDFFGVAQFGYTVSDDGEPNESVAGTVTVNVAPTPDAPIAVDDDAGSTAKNTSRSISTESLLSNDHDADDDLISVVSVVAIDGVTHGSATLNEAGTITYVPDLDYVGPASFTYTVNDPDLNFSTATVSIAVTTANGPPAALSQNVTADEDSAATIALSATDPDGDSITFSIVSAPLHGTLSEDSSGNYTYSPELNFNGEDSFTFIVNDGTIDSAPAAVSITVDPINDAPVAEVPGVQTDEDTPVVISLVASDVDGDDLSYAVVSDPSHGSLHSDGIGVFTYTPDNNFNGDDSFTLSVSDAASSIQASVPISVLPVNDAPVATPQDVQTPEGTTLSIILSATDVEGDPLTYSIIDGPLHGTLQQDAEGAYTFTPNAGYFGSDSFTITASDGALSTEATVSISVTAQNHDPVAIPDAYFMNEDQVLSLNAPGVLSNDVDDDGDSLQLTSISRGPSFGSLDFNPDGSLDYRPLANYNGGDSFSYIVSDGNGGTATADVSITIRAVNDAPIINADTVTAAEDATLTLTAADLINNDNSGPSEADQVLTLLSVQRTAATHVTVTLLNGVVTFIPDTDYFGPAIFTYSVVDDGKTNGSADSKISNGAVGITVSPVNDAPSIARIDDQTSTVGGTLSVVVTGLSAGPANEGLSQTLSLSATSDNSLVAADPVVTLNEDGTATLTYTAAGAGDARITVTATDSGGIDFDGTDSFSRSFAVKLSSGVVGRHLFYNNSVFDGNYPLGSRDDDAIAADKTALLPSGTASFGNVSSYTKGINGIMIDIDRLPVGAMPATDDFQVAVSSDGVTWTAGPSPTGMMVRPGAGTGGADRVELTWSDNSIQNEWMRLTVKAGSRTGLPAADVSYIGSAIAETGNDPSSLAVDAGDYFSIRNHLRTYDDPAPVTWAWDVNRDGVADGLDLQIIRAVAAEGTTVPLITAPAPLSAMLDAGLYGASPTASASTNTAALQQAIDVARETGQIVTLTQPGTYLVTQGASAQAVALKTALMVYDGSHVSLPSNVTIKLANNVLAYMVRNADPVNGNKFITMEGGTWDGNRANHPLASAQWKGFIFWFQYVDHLIARDMDFYNSVKYCIMPSACNYSLFENLYGYDVNCLVQCHGPSVGLTFRNLSGYSRDDILAFTASDYEYIRTTDGGFDDVFIDGVIGQNKADGTDGTYGVRFSGAPGYHFRNFQISNISGVFEVSPFRIIDDNAPGVGAGGGPSGLFGSEYDKIQVDGISATVPQGIPLAWIGAIGAERITLKNLTTNTSAGYAVWITEDGSNLDLKLDNISVPAGFANTMVKVDGSYKSFQISNTHYSGTNRTTRVLTLSGTATPGITRLSNIFHSSGVVVELEAGIVGTTTIQLTDVTAYKPLAVVYASSDATALISGLVFTAESATAFGSARGTSTLKLIGSEFTLFGPRLVNFMQKAVGATLKVNFPDLPVDPALLTPDEYDRGYDATAHATGLYGPVIFYGGAWHNDTTGSAALTLDKSSTLSASALSMPVIAASVDPNVDSAQDTLQEEDTSIAVSPEADKQFIGDGSAIETKAPVASPTRFVKIGALSPVRVALDNVSHVTDTRVFDTELKTLSRGDSDLWRRRLGL